MTNAMDEIRQRYAKFDKTLRKALPYITNAKSDAAVEKARLHNAVVDLARVSTIRKLVEKDYDAAKATAIRLGLCGEFDKLTPGAHDTFDTKDVHVAVVVNNPGEQIDRKLLESELTARLGHAGMVKVLVASLVPTQGARVIGATIKPKDY